GRSGDLGLRPASVSPACNWETVDRDALIYAARCAAGSRYAAVAPTARNLSLWVGCATGMRRLLHPAFSIEESDRLFLQECVSLCFSILAAAVCNRLNISACSPLHISAMNFRYRSSPMLGRKFRSSASGEST